MKSYSSLLRHAGIFAAALASIATTDPKGYLLERQQTLDLVVTLNPREPTKTLAFAVQGRDAVGFSIQRQDVEYTGKADPTRACVALTTYEYPEDAGFPAPAFVCVPKGTALPNVLIQTRRRASPQEPFSKALSVDFGHSKNLYLKPGVRVPACFDVEEGTLGISDAGRCVPTPQAYDCVGSDACVEVFEARIFRTTPTSAAQTIKLRAIGTALYSSNQPGTAEITELR
jgi:hypothetical protein